MFAQDTLLIASPSVDNRHTIRSIFEEGFHLLEADGHRQTILLLEQNQSCIATVILDVTMPDKLNISTLEQIVAMEALQHVPVVVLTPPDQPEAVGDALIRGAVEAMSAEFESVVLRQRVMNIVDLYRHKRHLEELVAEQASILKHSNDTMVDVLSSIIEHRSVESGQHILRIRRFTHILLQELARSCPGYGLTEQSIQSISSAAALHDIGKISIPDAILNKPGRLTGEEWEVMKRHAEIGGQIIETLGNLGDVEYLRYAYNICRYHHERWDGRGYPEGISGDHIPVCAQVVGLADAYDALTTKRVYKDAIRCEQATNMIIGGECGVFSPRLLECFKNVAGQFAEVAAAYADGLSPKSEQFETALPEPAQLEELDALQMIRSKYQMLLHYVDATVVEVDLERGIYHVVYNPDPNLTVLSGGVTLQELDRHMVDQAHFAGERAIIQSLVRERMPRFLKEGLLRMRHRVPVYTKLSDKPELYDLTILRQSLALEDGKKILVIWERVQGNEADAQTKRGMDALQRIPPSLVPSYCRFRNDRMMTLEDFDDKICHILGYDRQDLQEAMGSELVGWIVPEDREMVRQKIAQQLQAGKSLELEYRLRHRDGHMIWVLNRCRLEVCGDGSEVFSGFWMDISASKQSQDAMRDQLDRHKIILSQTENVMFEWDVDEDSAVFSDNWIEIFGCEPLTWGLSKRIATDSHFHPEDTGQILELFHSMKEGMDYQVCEVRLAKADGRYLWCRIRATARRDDRGELRKIVGIIINIDDEKRSAQALQERAERDVLTKLLNKHAARQQVERYLESFGGNLECALFIIDLDNFKTINDRYGHLFGDAVLVQVAKEIRRFFRAQDIVARIGGDEFLVLMRGISDGRIVEDRCRRLVEAFHNVMGQQLGKNRLSCSVGVALYPSHGSSYAELFQRADQALYHAKDTGKDGFAVYDSTDTGYYNRKKLDTAINERIDSDDQKSLSNSNIIQYAFRCLYESGDVELTIREILASVGRQMNVSRVYIFENSPDNLSCSNTFEWCNEGIQAEMSNLQNLSYETDIPNFMDNFNEQGIFYCPDITQLPGDLYHLLEKQNIKSVLLCAIRDNGVMRGYIGFDECLVNRYWTKEQIQLLTYFAEMLSVFLMKKRTEDAYARLRGETE